MLLLTIYLTNVRTEHVYKRCVIIQVVQNIKLLNTLKSIEVQRLKEKKIQWCLYICKVLRHYHIYSDTSFSKKDVLYT
jgi:hypothetical protein